MSLMLFLNPVVRKPPRTPATNGSPLPEFLCNPPLSQHMPPGIKTVTRYEINWILFVVEDKFHISPRYFSLLSRWCRVFSDAADRVGCFCWSGQNVAGGWRHRAKQIVKSTPARPLDKLPSQNVCPAGCENKDCGHSSSCVCSGLIVQCVCVVTVAEPGLVDVYIYVVLYGTAPSVCGYSYWAVPPVEFVVKCEQGKYRPVFPVQS